MIGLFTFYHFEELCLEQKPTKNIKTNKEKQKNKTKTKTKQTKQRTTSIVCIFIMFLKTFICLSLPITFRSSSYLCNEFILFQITHGLAAPGEQATMSQCQLKNQQLLVNKRQCPGAGSRIRSIQRFLTAKAIMLCYSLTTMICYLTKE